ncbi:HAUS3 protein, partial [Alcedo cyanopectus]|nr:HAUS3 protein [Ceyx cyanopectus]
IMTCGKDFVETLKRIGYPEADELNGEDFDWLFESSDVRTFLEWFCANVSEQHVVSEAELQAFEKLLESGKPILEGNALDEALKTLKPMDSTRQEEEELKELEEELQGLQRLKRLQTHRNNKFQLLVAANNSVLQTLNSKEQEVHEDFKEGLEVFTAASSKLSEELLSFMEAAEKFASLFSASGSAEESGTNPMFFSQLSLDNYLSQEDQSTAALMSYMKSHCYPAMPEWMENLHTGSAQQEDRSEETTCEETPEASEESREIASLYTAYICAQHQLLQLQAKQEGMNSAVECAESILQSLSKEMGQQENLDAKISSLNDEISALKADISRINNEELLPLLKEKAQAFCAPLVRGYLEQQLAQHRCCAARQDEICRHLGRQASSFDLIEVAYKLELKKQKDISCQLESLVEAMEQCRQQLQQRLQVVAEQARCAKPRKTISSSDAFSSRLYQLLEGDCEKQQLFRTYESLEQMAQKLKQDCAAAQEQLEASSEEEDLCLSRLEGDVGALHDALYHGGGELQLSSQELTEQFNQLEDDINKLDKLLKDLMNDLKSKRNFLESNKLHQMERNLYVYFLQDEARWKEVMELLEQQSEAKASGLEDESSPSS